MLRRSRRLRAVRPVRRRVTAIGRRRRFHRRPPIRRPRVFRRRARRRILNVSTVKKNDVMLNAAVNGSGGGVIGPVVAPTNLYSLFMCTARPEYNGVGSDKRSRKTQDTFARGYKEIWKFEIQNSTAWAWRRIVFSFKGDIYVGAGTPGDTPYFDSPANGMSRAINSLSVPALAALEGVIFAGSRNVDWQDHMVAMVDTERVGVISDTFRVLRGVTVTDAHIHRGKDWVAINRPLIYNDHESGKDDILTNYTSQQDNRSIGDVYIYDIWEPESYSSSETENMKITLEGRYYWHER